MPNLEHPSRCTADPKPSRRKNPPWEVHQEPRPHESLEKASCPVRGPSILPPTPGSPTPVTAQGLGGCPLLLQRAAPENPLGADCVPLRAPVGDTRAPGPGRCRSATQALPYRVCGRRRRNERAESGPGRARPSVRTRAAGDWLSWARLRRGRDGAGPGRGGATGRSPVRKLRLAPEIANSSSRTAFLILQACFFCKRD